MFAEWLNARLELVFLGIGTYHYMDSNNGIISIRFDFSVKYVILDPADVVKYGLNAAINPYLDNKVDKNENLIIR